MMDYTTSFLFQFDRALDFSITKVFLIPQASNEQYAETLQFVNSPQAGDGSKVEHTEIQVRVDQQLFIKVSCICLNVLVCVQ
jgi:hypothetical protein